MTKRVGLVLVSVALGGACGVATDVDADTVGTAGSGGSTAEAGDDAGTSSSSGSLQSSSSTATVDGDSSTGDDAEPIDPSSLTGPELYAVMCSACHGATGEGTDDFGYELRHPTRAHANWVVRNGRVGDEFPDAVMAAFPLDAVTDVQLAEMWDWLDGFPQPVDGAALYSDYCGNCHGADAAGGSVGAGIKGEFFLKVLWVVRNGEHTADVGSRVGYMPAFELGRLTDAEIQSIVDYVATL